LLLKNTRLLRAACRGITGTCSWMLRRRTRGSARTRTVTLKLLAASGRALLGLGSTFGDTALALLLALGATLRPGP
jgi:uncharacterized iron-regulated membrane protein